jgi:hypothetical protein
MFPWVILLINDDPGGAFVALIMQATIIGWPFAASKAMAIVREQNNAAKKLKEEKLKQKEKEQELQNKN